VLHELTLRHGWLCRTFLHFAGVNNAMYAWLNGQLLGYSQDSCLPAEFEVTHVLRSGRNLLSVQVSC
jgi:beta-galactosidase